MYIVLTETVVIANWHNIYNDEFYVYPEIKNVREFINRCKKGEITMGGFQIVISNALPKFEQE